MRGGSSLWTMPTSRRYPRRLIHDESVRSDNRSSPLVERCSAQPPIARWNLARLAEAMIPLLHDDGKKAVELANEALHQFEGIFQNHWLDGMRAKLGLSNEEPDDRALVQQLVE